LYLSSVVPFLDACRANFRVRLGKKCLYTLYD
jgi:hypothetical protein